VVQTERICMTKHIKDNIERDGIDRRGFLNCMTWAGTTVVYSLSGGVAHSQVVGHDKHTPSGSLSFAQISDNHIGFNKEANSDVAGTLKEAVAKINALDRTPAFLIHTGDIS